MFWLQHDNFNNYYTIRSFLYISVRNRSLNLLKKNSLTTEKMIRVQQNSLSEAQESEMVIETEVERRTRPYICWSLLARWAAGHPDAGWRWPTAISPSGRRSG